MYTPPEFSDEVAFSTYLANKYVSKRRSAHTRGLDFDLSLTDFIALFNRKLCPYTGDRLTYSRSEHSKDATLDRIDNTKGYIKGNVILCTLKANAAKGVLTIDEMEKIAKVCRFYLTRKT